VRDGAARCCAQRGAYAGRCGLYRARQCYRTQRERMVLKVFSRVSAHARSTSVIQIIYSAVIFAKRREHAASVAAERRVAGAALRGEYAARAVVKRREMSYR